MSEQWGLKCIQFSHFKLSFGNLSHRMPETNQSSPFFPLLTEHRFDVIQLKIRKKCVSIPSISIENLVKIGTTCKDKNKKLSFEKLWRVKKKIDLASNQFFFSRKMNLFETDFYFTQMHFAYTFFFIRSSDAMSM